MDALIIVDLQNDFCPGGALPAPHGNDIVLIINELMGRFDFVIASRDEHPGRTRHFEKWPPHCIKGSLGANFHPQLDTKKIQKVFLKGTGDKDDGYSAFEATNENLNKFLLKNKITGLYVSGLTTEYCVKNTLIDSIKHGYNTYVIEDAIAAVQPDSDREKEVFAELRKSGVRFIKSEMIIKI